ncbi:hypothetical protein EZV76_15815 [Flagellimonas alvinocaridis]|jgi:hypothetical protein|uniref:Uncharacterized protein n=1 Tax=Flagellimonas alvinocaridis TaxID=2530200 RepID=A0A4S8RHS8_9FLAO|nr:hypothetical protein [Allomuricauda alvinocaridis]THV57082.1 hypothetical protein EZV76_15815 [Allomuricauda alvinocaridis]
MKKNKNKKWMYVIGGLVAAVGVLILWLLGKTKKPCECEKEKGSDPIGKGGGTGKGGTNVGDTGGTGSSNGSNTVSMTVEEYKDLLLNVGKSGCGC